MSSKYTINGREVTLSSKDFVAAGGQGSVFIKGKTAYKIYSDIKHIIPTGKIKELAALNKPFIVKPDDLILDKSNKAVGYTMQALKDTYSLCQMFPKAFRTRKNLTEDMVFKLVQKFQEGVKFVHSNGILIVDVNELNFTIDDHFKEVYFLDVDSYQTKSYPATALMDSVKDRHTKGFNENTDWFSWAVVSFQMFVGIHPYKGMYDAFNSVPKEQRMEERMQKNISVFHKDVRVPAVVLPFSVIPDAYKHWYEAVFEKGLRQSPPEGTHLVLVVPSVKRQTGQIGSSIFDIVEAYEFPDDVVSYFNGYVSAGYGIYKGSKLITDKISSDVKLAQTPRSHTPICARVDQGQLRILNASNGQPLQVNALGEALMSYNGNLYIKYGEAILEVQLNEIGGRIIVTTKTVANVMPNSTQMLDGCAITSVLGRYHAVLIPETGHSYQPQLKELDGYTIVDAKFSRGVLVIVGALKGKYDQFIYRFDSVFRDYDVRINKDVTATGINFTVLDNGLCMLMLANDDLELFSNRPHSQNLSVLSDPAVQGDVKLISEGAQAMFIRGNKIYKFNMKRKP